jgi:hypothetical protein
MFENHNNYNCEITLDNNEQYRVYANWLRNNDLHHWQGWNCEAGATHIHIDKNLTVWSGECKNNWLGSVDQGWQLFDNHSICQQDSCTGCTDDLLTAKWKP